MLTFVLEEKVGTKLKNQKRRGKIQYKVVIVTKQFVKTKLKSRIEIVEIHGKLDMSRQSTKRHTKKKKKKKKKE